MLDCATHSVLFVLSVLRLVHSQHYLLCENAVQLSHNCCNNPLQVVKGRCRSQQQSVVCMVCMVQCRVCICIVPTPHLYCLKSGSWIDMNLWTQRHGTMNNVEYELWPLHFHFRVRQKYSVYMVVFTWFHWDHDLVIFNFCCIMPANNDPSYQMVP